MGQKIQLSESQLRNLIKESVKKSIGGYENQYADDKGNLIQSRKDSDGKKHWRTVKDPDYKKEKGGKFNKEEYSDVYSDEHGNHIQSRIDGNGKKHWKVVKKVDENAKMASVKLTESQLHKLIRESVKKALAEEKSWFDNPINAARYDNWRTSDPRDDQMSDMISKEDFYDTFYSYDKKELLEWLKEFDQNVYNEAIKAEKTGTGDAFNVTLERLGWKEIASDFLDLRPVEYYPGDMDY